MALAVAEAQASALAVHLVRAGVPRQDVPRAVAAIALGAASQDPSLTDDLPQDLWDGLDGGPEGQALLRAADAALHRRFG